VHSKECRWAVVWWKTVTRPTLDLSTKHSATLTFQPTHHNLFTYRSRIIIDKRNPSIVCDLSDTSSFCFVTHHTLVWQVLLRLLFSSVSCYRYVGDGGTDRRAILHGGIYRSPTNKSSLWAWGRYPREIPKSNFWPSKSWISPKR